MSLQESIAALAGQSVSELTRLHGGDLSDVYGVRLQDGAECVAKASALAPTEADMLQRIAGTGCPCPDVLATSDTLFLMTRLPEAGGAGSTAWQSLGTGLRRLHDTQGTNYGWDRDYAFGAVRIDNTPGTSWPEFWAERRLLPGLPALPREMAVRLETLAMDLPNRLPGAPPKSLLHGDLWSGNLVFDGDRFAGLIDPACYYGDAEVDFAMLTLFGSPPQAVFDGYGPLAPGHEDRRSIYQLWPAMVHVRLFGAGYLSMVNRLLDQAGV